MTFQVEGWADVFTRKTYKIIRFFASKSMQLLKIGLNSNLQALFALRSSVFQPLTYGKFTYWQNSVCPKNLS
ncbi:MAG: hypothetical protein C0433_09850 [Cyclobacterium sp.]|nr:hypothetical protein [Cyclobacterium sp.]